MNKKILILNIVWFCVLVGSMYGVYEYTKESYRKVGFSDGIIDYKMEIIGKLKELKKLPICQNLSNEDMVPFFDVKSTSVYYLLSSKSDEIRFCIWE